jgi:hypothetical protein
MDTRTMTPSEEAEADPTGFVPGKGNAYDYLPEWMTVPGLYQTEGRDDPPAVIKLFTPDSSWTWYVVESDGDTCFGLVAGMETELGYFTLSEMRGVTGPLGLQIERDLWFRPVPVTRLAEYRARWGDDGPYAGSRQIEEAREPETPIRDEDYVSLPEGWTVEDVRFLLEKLEEGPILVADTELGIPTIHDVKGQVEHCGFGLMKATAREFTVTFDAGGAMQRTPSGRSWSFLKVTAGEYPYDTEGVQATLQHYVDCAAAQPATCRTGGDETRTVQEVIDAR